MRRQIQYVLPMNLLAELTNRHMIKYRYIPFDLGKKRGYGKK
jgi:hypothetical protein